MLTGLYSHTALEGLQHNRQKVQAGSHADGCAVPPPLLLAAAVIRE